MDANGRDSDVRPLLTFICCFNELFCSGDSTFCNSEGSNMFITNLVDGIDQYKLPEFEKVKVFSHAIKSNYPLQVVTAYRGNWLLSGGDSGFARLFDRRTGRLLQQLDHGNGELQSCAVSSID